MKFRSFSLPTCPLRTGRFDCPKKRIKTCMPCGHRSQGKGIPLCSGRNFLIFFKNQETVHKILKFLHACLTCVLQAGLQNFFTPARLESFRRGFYSYILLKKNDLNFSSIKLIAFLLSIIHVN
jgi:hypothetical protein